MHVSLYRCKKYLALRPGSLSLLVLEIRQQIRNRLLHYSRAFYDLWQEHFPRTKQVSHNIHTVHQRTFYHLNRSAVFLTGFFRILFNIVCYTFHKRMRQTFLNRFLPPAVILFLFLALSFDLLRVLY